VTQVVLAVEAVRWMAPMPAIGAAVYELSASAIRNPRAHTASGAPDPRTSRSLIESRSEAVTSVKAILLSISADGGYPTQLRNAV
jgi:hypothetical protein